jgi:hypothetical protein
MSRLAVPSFELTTGATAEIDAQIEGPFGQPVLSPDVATSLPTVQFSPIDSVKRHSTARHGIVAESFYAPMRSSIQIYYNAPYTCSCCTRMALVVRVKHRLMGYLHRGYESSPIS